MIAPFERFRWARLPFGLEVSSEIFQRRLHKAIADLPGIICVADDIMVIGSGDTEEIAERDHEKKLAALRNMCKVKHIILNDGEASVVQW